MSGKKRTRKRNPLCLTKKEKSLMPMTLMLKTIAKQLQVLRMNQKINLTMKSSKSSPSFKMKKGYELKRKKNKPWLRKKLKLSLNLSLSLNRIESNTSKNLSSKPSKSQTQKIYRTFFIKEYLMEFSVKVLRRYMHLKWKSCGLSRCGFKGDVI